jgi:PAS domain S-box-containing protein
MSSWFERLSIRTQIVLLTLAIALPAAAGLAWWAAARQPQGTPQAPLQGVLGLALALALLALCWRVSAAIVRPWAALRDSEADLRRLLTLLPEAVVLNQGNRVSFVNDAAQRLLGADEAALLGRSSLDLFGAGSIAVAKSRILALHASTSVAPVIEEEIRRADGSTRVVETTATLIEERGETAILAVMRDVTELKQAQAALIESHADLQRLLAAQDKVQENERKRIARELHDDLQQTLAVIRIDLGVIATRMAAGSAGVATMLAGVDAHVEAAISSTRRIVNDLRPQMLEDLGLVAALEAMAGQLAQRAGMVCQVEAQPAAGDALREAPLATTCLYRVAQEALNNVLKHAQASTVRLGLEHLADGRVALRVSDNGRGIGSGEPHKPDSFGLRGIAERVRALGGVLRIDSPPGAGTTIEVIVPVPGQAAVPPGALAPAPPGEPAGTSRRDAGPSPAEGDLLQAVIDALAGNVAVLGPDGAIELVNQAWREFADRNGDPGMRACGPGTNYLEVCRRSAFSDKRAERVLQGLHAVLGGQQRVFVSEYPCDAPDEQRWFRLHAAPMAAGKVLVTHFNLTAWVDQARKGEADPEGR